MSDQADGQRMSDRTENNKSADSDQVQRQRETSLTTSGDAKQAAPDVKSGDGKAAQIPESKSTSDEVKKYTDVADKLAGLAVTAVTDKVQSIAAFTPIGQVVGAAKGAYHVATAENKAEAVKEEAKDRINAVSEALAGAAARKAAYEGVADYAKGDSPDKAALVAADTATQHVPFAATVVEVENTEKAVQRGDTVQAVVHGVEAAENFTVEAAGYVAQLVGVAEGPVAPGTDPAAPASEGGAAKAEPPGGLPESAPRPADTSSQAVDTGSDTRPDQAAPRPDETGSRPDQPGQGRVDEPGNSTPGADGELDQLIQEQKADAAAEFRGETGLTPSGTESLPDETIPDGEEPGRIPELDSREPSRPDPDRMQQGNDFDRAQRGAYTADQVRLTNRGVVDSLTSDTGGVSRKHAQLAEISQETAQKYVTELVEKYGPGRVVADTPKNNAQYPDLVGQRLTGDMVLEVPVQQTPIPQEFGDWAARQGVTIRDYTGEVLNGGGQR